LAEDRLKQLTKEKRLLAKMNAQGRAEKAALEERLPKLREKEAERLAEEAALKASVEILERETQPLRDVHAKLVNQELEDCAKYYSTALEERIERLQTHAVSGIHEYSLAKADDPLSESHPSLCQSKSCLSLPDSSLVPTTSVPSPHSPKFQELMAQELESTLYEIVEWSAGTQRNFIEGIGISSSRSS
jgi:hypothetical protein